MANYDSLINAVKAAVKTNGTGAITGATLQATLLGTIEALTVGYQFMGVATPSTSPDSNDKKEFYIGFAGTYANFGDSVTVSEGSLILFKKTASTWSSQVVKIANSGYIPAKNWSLVMVNSGSGVFSEMETGNRIGTMFYIPVKAGDVIKSTPFAMNYCWYAEPNVASYDRTKSNTAWDANNKTIGYDGYIRVFARYSDQNPDITEAMKQEMIASISIPDGRFIAIETDIDKLQDDVETLQDDVETLQNETDKLNKIQTPNWSYVAASVQDGSITPVPSGNRIGTLFYIPVKAGDIIKSTPYALNYFWYSQPNESTYNSAKSNTAWTTADKTISDDGYIRIFVRYSSSDTDITEAMKAEISASVSVPVGRIVALENDVKELTNSLDNEFNKIPINDWSFVSVAAATGVFTPVESGDRIGTMFYIPVKAGDIIKSAPFALNYCWYSQPNVASHDSSKSNTIWDAADKTIGYDGYIRVFMRYSSENPTITETMKAEMVAAFLYNGIQLKFIKESILQLDTKVSQYDSRIDAPLLQDGMGLTMKNYRYKIGSIERGEQNQCIIGLLGDSWTQHSGASYLPAHSNYAQPIAKYLRDKFGNAGGGYYSFSVSHISTTPLQKMASVDPADATDERSSSGITYQDQVSGVKGIDAADALFGNGTYLTLNVLTNHDKLVIHFWGDSNAGKFTYTLDNGTAISVDASQYSGHSTIAIDTTDTPHTLRFDITDGSVMLFGVDMQRTAPGVRVHKFGNKGATSGSFVQVDSDAWKAFVASFGLDTMTILLGMNDGPSSTTIDDNLITIIQRIKAVNTYCDLCIIQPAGGTNYDFTNQSKLQLQAAKTEKTGFINLITLFGSKEQITNKGTFVSDGIHPTLAGGRMIADYIIDKLFNQM